MWCLENLFINNESGLLGKVTLRTVWGRGEMNRETSLEAGEVVLSDFSLPLKHQAVLLQKNRLGFIHHWNLQPHFWFWLLLWIIRFISSCQALYSVGIVDRGSGYILLGVCSQDKKMFLGAIDTGEGWHFTGPANLLFGRTGLVGKESRKHSRLCRTSRESSSWRRRLLVRFSVPPTPTSWSKQSVWLCNLKFHRLLPLVNLCSRPHGRGTCALLSKSPDFIYGHVSHGFTHSSHTQCLFPAKALENADSWGI